MAAFAITVANTFKHNLNAIKIKAFKEPAKEEVILRPNESKDYTLEEYDSLTISIPRKKHVHGPFYIWLPSIVDTRFITKRKVDLTIIHKSDGQEMITSSSPHRWKLIVTPSKVNVTLGKTEPPPDNVTVGDEAPQIQ